MPEKKTKKHIVPPLHRSAHVAAESIGLKEPPPPFPATSSDETREGEAHDDNDSTEWLLFASRDWISSDEDSRSES